MFRTVSVFQGVIGWSNRGGLPCLMSGYFWFTMPETPSFHSCTPCWEKSGICEHMW